MTYIDNLIARITEIAIDKPDLVMVNDALDLLGEASEALVQLSTLPTPLQIDAAEEAYQNWFIENGFVSPSSAGIASLGPMKAAAEVLFGAKY